MRSIEHITKELLALTKTRNKMGLNPVGCVKMSCLTVIAAGAFTIAFQKGLKRDK
jgi:hypothetical protein